MNQAPADLEAAEKYATSLVPVYESGVCVGQEPYVDERESKAYLAGIQHEREKCRLSDEEKSVMEHVRLMVNDKDEIGQAQTYFEEVLFRALDRLTKATE